MEISSQIRMKHWARGYRVSGLGIVFFERNGCAAEIEALIDPLVNCDIGHSLLAYAPDQRGIEHHSIATVAFRIGTRKAAQDWISRIGVELLPFV